MGVKHLVMLGYPDGELEDTRQFLGDVVRAIRKHRPHTVFVHDPYRIQGFQHRDHRKAGITTTDAVYPFARDHLHFPEHVAGGARATQGARAVVLGRGQPTSSSTSASRSTGRSPPWSGTRARCPGSTWPTGRRSARG